MESGSGPWPHSDLAESDPTFFFGDSLGRRPEARPWGIRRSLPCFTVSASPSDPPTSMVP